MQRALGRIATESKHINGGEATAVATRAAHRIARDLRWGACLDEREHARIASLVDSMTSLGEPLEPLPAWREPTFVPGEAFVLLPTQTVRLRVDDAGIESARTDAETAAAIDAAKSGALCEVNAMGATRNPHHLTDALSYPVLEDAADLRTAGRSIGLSVAMATISHLYTRALSPAVVGMAEVNYTGKLAPVNAALLHEGVRSVAACWPRLVKTLVVADGQAVLEETQEILDARRVRLVRCRRIHERHHGRKGALEIYFPNGVQENFIPKVQKYLNDLRLDVEPLCEGYVEGDFVRLQGKPFDVDAWLASSEPVTYVSGEFGTGKTAFCLNLVRKLCTSPSPIKPRIVAHVDLARVTLDGGALDRLVPRQAEAARELLAVFNIDSLGSTARQLKDLSIHEYPLLIVLEGLDEITDPRIARSLMARAITIADFASMGGERSVQFVISGRVNMLREHFRAIYDDLTLRVPKKWLILDQETADPKLIMLHLLTKEQVMSFIASRHSDRPRDVANIQRLLRENEKLLELCSRPLVLYLLGHSLLTSSTEVSGMEIKSHTLFGVFEHVWNGYAKRLQCVEEPKVRAALERVAYRTWLYACQLARSSGEPHVNNTNLTFNIDWFKEALREAGVDDGRKAHYLQQILVAPLFRRENGDITWAYRMFLDYFIARYVAAHLDTAVNDSRESLQVTFCRLGLLDLLREAVDRTEEIYLRSLLLDPDGTDETRVFASHLLRRAVFNRSLPALQTAYKLCRENQSKIFLIFAILSHQEEPAEHHLEFVKSHEAELVSTLRLFVEGQDADVCHFNTSRLLKEDHRGKAILYLISLRQVGKTRPTEVREVVQQFLQKCAPRSIEEAFAREVLESIGAPVVQPAG
ncbi:hypothetical protein WME76_09645 [Sorangium sp. So ce119]|uniref:NACHT domain-containing protein n=1 Tax=Sorangium sp. So ce119 TaxID=3133279 RepID=UPI003F604501